MPAGRIAISWPTVFLSPSLEVRKLFFITIPTVLIFLIALELCLRLCGYFYVQSHHPEKHTQTAGFNKDEFKILCLGDSFTFGIGADPGGSYPRQLEKILQKNISEKISVINGGRLANTSSLLLKKIQADIDEYSPSMIIIMIGISNSWNLEDSSYFLLYGSNMSFFERLEKLLSVLSIYKLLRIGFDHLKSEKKIGPKTLISNDLSQKKDSRVEELTGAGERLYREGKNILAIEKAKEALTIDGTDYAAHLILAQALLARGERQSAKEELWRAIHLVKAWDANLVSGTTIMLMAINSDNDFALLEKHLRGNIEKKKDNDFILLKKYLRENVEKKKSDFLIKMIEASLDLRKNSKTVGAVLDYDLGQIAGLARRKGIKLILLTYPGEEMEKVNLNSVIIAASQKYHTGLIDNGIIFKGKPRSELFIADGHCNEKGYGLVAENVYETLVKNGMLPAGTVGARGDGR